MDDSRLLGHVEGFLVLEGQIGGLAEEAILVDNAGGFFFEEFGFASVQRCCEQGSVPDFVGVVEVQELQVDFLFGFHL